MLGEDQPVILHLLDIPYAAEALEGVRMELVDAAYPLVKGERACHAPQGPLQPSRSPHLGSPRGPAS